MRGGRRTRGRAAQWPLTAEQAPAPATEKEPGAHGTQALEAASAYEPALHGAHDVTPAALALVVTEPGTHAEHAAAPATAEKVPGPHQAHTPSGDAYVPAMHGEQTLL